METNCANKIIKELQSILPSDWEKVFFCMEYEEGTFSADCFVFLENELKPIYASIEGVSKDLFLCRLAKENYVVILNNKGQTIR